MSKKKKLKLVQQTEKAIRVAAFRARKAARREKLILSHMHVVEKLAFQVHRHMTHVDIEDLRQAGCVGLTEAANRYKPSCGVFEHYAYFRVRGAMIDAHKRAAYRDDTLFIHSIDELQTGNRDQGRSNLPVIPAIDGRPLPDELAAKREQAKLLSLALQDLEADERKVFLNSLQGIPLLLTARECQRSLPWVRAKLASARQQLGARVQMWGLGLDMAA